MKLILFYIPNIYLPLSTIMSNTIGLLILSKIFSERVSFSGLSSPKNCS